MKTGYVDTTILTDVLLKTGERQSQAKEALASFARTELPVYAIKEFSAGPLQNFAWLHNKLVHTHSLRRTLDLLQRMSMTPRRYVTATAIQALTEAHAAAADSGMTNQELVEKYGPDAELDKTLTDHYRLALRTRIMRAWSRRRRMTTAVVEELPCYIEDDPSEERGLLLINSRKCRGRCAMADRLRIAKAELETLLSVLQQGKGRESERRYQVLKKIQKRGRHDISDKECKSFGDAAFVVLAPPDSVILTTNRRDFEPLADALGKSIMVPESS